MDGTRRLFLESQRAQPGDDHVLKVGLPGVDHVIDVGRVSGFGRTPFAAIGGAGPYREALRIGMEFSAGKIAGRQATYRELLGNVVAVGRDGTVRTNDHF